MDALLTHDSIRDATVTDAAACAAIYAPYVTDTSITFELDPPSAEEMARRITEAQRHHAWIVMEDEEGVLGYAYGGTFRTRAAYRRTCEVSVYLEGGRRRRGAGRALYSALMPRLAARGMHTAIACMTLPNDASLGLHRAMGFEDVGIMRRVGHKHDAWHDVAWAQLDLTPAP
ncbi:MULTISPECIES: GNAT family N-acetyltransferase [unclassified Nocardiopsis]|jgi:L-amino acid N-acyltransferase YncA|uniref:GNAT family N-acetyltransferase n=1 Tax=unclassified Nocardiopsis TaxID=2649073 RepID=UPI00066C33A0|nr:MULTISPECIES: GNAT family N-acetyltransferase [unclassified Nocardiopsis]MBQ1079905.1 N-acetyltransferase [Nocardiopsis sp. B62]